MGSIDARENGGDADLTAATGLPAVVAIQPRGLPMTDWNALRCLDGASHFNLQIDHHPLFEDGAHPGASTPPCGCEITRLSALIRCLGKSLHLVGFGVASPVALAVAHANRDIVRSVTLVEPLVLGILEPSDRVERLLLDAHQSVVAECAHLVLQGRVAEAGNQFRRFIGGAFDEHRDPDHRETLLRHLMPSISGSITSARMRDVGQWIANLPVPTQLIIGEHAAALMQYLAVKLLGMLPSASLVRVDGAGFLPHLTHPNTVLGAINGHVARAQFRAPAADARVGGTASYNKRESLTFSREKQQ